MKKNHQVEIEKAEGTLRTLKKSVDESHWKLYYHVTAPANWINDPNGLGMFQGEYHLFYQHHPYSPQWGPMFWGHVKSKDLVHWERLPIALAPSEEYDQDGCFSGSSIERDGKFYLMYTGNEWTGPDHDQDLKQVQCIAVSEDGVRFEKIAENPVISEAPEGDIHPFHFRDPKVWKKGDYFYCVLGSRTKDHHGQVLLYRSVNMMDWEFISIMAKSSGDLGFMWECPDVFELAGKDILMMSPQGVKPEGHLYHNLHQAGYVTGQLDYETGILTHGDLELLDYGFDFYAPQTLEDTSGRRVMIAWMAMWESEMPDQQHRWAGAMTLPRELRLKDGKIFSNPIEELKTLRKNSVELRNVMVNGLQDFEGISGDCCELEMVIDAKNASTFGLKVRVDEASKQETVLSYNRETSLFTLNREHSGEGPGGERQALLPLKDNQLYLRVFIDKSSVELFINHGECVMTARIYPREQAKGIQFFADQKIELISLSNWNLARSIQ
ncbi:glycoside hydrolase family 32 protein [Bacillus sp. MRMR6]|uniref:glycoside hydrolase family 32 protein n=1 Tax=Bacillus sp. MRMR6 TaxID=1928617 RepID=UPI000951D144|nr:glycoside hydrolase family 32 protein [Bacillus sp. MRMR6]OLS40554.1 sucrose-6-phosphate hydrolase [Bacillus sp. MRMR6]